jgi:hypothetical protein
MRKVLGALLIVLSFALSSPADVIAPSDETPFDIKETDQVRLTAQGIAGARFEAKVEGPAKLIERKIIRLAKGRPLIGAQTREFDVTPTGTGKVTVTITVIPPQPDAKAMEKTYTLK